MSGPIGLFGRKASGLGLEGLALRVERLGLRV